MIAIKGMTETYNRFHDPHENRAEHLRLLRRTPSLRSTRSTNGQRTGIASHSPAEHPAGQGGHDRRGPACPAVHTDRFWGTDWPGSSQPAVYYDPRSLDPSSPSGVLHAKAVVVDDEAVFITSANLTGAALDRNIELGVLIRHRALAAGVANHFQGLIDARLLSPLPTA